MTALAELTWDVEQHDTLQLDDWVDPFDPTPVWARADLRKVADALAQPPLLVLIGRHAGRPVLAAPVLVSAEPGGLLFYDPVAMVGDERAFGTAPLPAVADAAREAAYPCLAIGIHGGHHGIVVDPASDPAERLAACRALPAAVSGLARDLGCRSHALLYLTAKAVAALTPAGEPVVLGAQSSFGCAGDTFEDYLAGLGAHRRKQVRKERAGYLASANTTTVSEGADALGDDLVDLRCRLRARYGHPVQRERTEREFAALAEHCAERIVTFRSVQAGDTVGFTVFLRDGNTLNGRTAGFDYDRLGSRDFCYFNLGYYEPLMWALDHGLHRVEMGLSSYPAKRTRGCSFEPRFGIFDVPAPLQLVLRDQDRSERARLLAECGPSLSTEGLPPWT